MDECEGTFKINDINQMESDFQIVSIDIPKETNISNKARDILKKCLADEIISILRNMTSDLMAHESNPQKLAQDKLLREETDKKYHEVVSTVGHEKDKLLQEQLLAEQNRNN